MHDPFWPFGGHRLNYEISLFHDKFYFNKLKFRNHKRVGGKSIQFLKALFITNSKINVSRPCLWRYLVYLAPKFVTS